MRAIMVSVDYSDLLSFTLPRNLHHFSEVWIVTSKGDHPNVVRVVRSLPEHHTKIVILSTDLFYADGAIFNKFRALEWGLDQMGRFGWICHMDADVVWPKLVDMSRYLRRGYLYSPLRRMCDPVPRVIPPESEWDRYPIHPQFREWAGYTQVYHAEDEVLGAPPWHPINWRHAGGGDSEFQARWHGDKKIRPPFEVLHLGSAGRNWCGRATPYLNGAMHPESATRVQSVRAFIRGRGQGADRFKGEKLEIPAGPPRIDSEASESTEAG